jgi:hypothetical protein
MPLGTKVMFVGCSSYNHVAELPSEHTVRCGEIRVRNRANRVLLGGNAVTVVQGRLAVPPATSL